MKKTAPPPKRPAKAPPPKKPAPSKKMPPMRGIGSL